jgi:Family of unknown function (DUF5677)
VNDPFLVTTKESEEMSQLLISIVNAESTSDHLKAIQALSRVILKFYRGVLLLVGDQNGLAAQALVRTLFETVVSGVILAKSPSLLSKFFRHGRFTHLRTLHFAKTDINEEAGLRRAALHERYRAEIDSLFAEFGEKSWHGMGTVDSFEAAGFERSLHGRYYRSASAIAHGAPHSVVRVTEDGGISLEPTAVGGINTLYGAYIMGSLIVLHFLEQLDPIFDFEFAERIAVSRGGIDVWKTRHVEFFKQVAERRKSNSRSQ